MAKKHAVKYACTECGAHATYRKPGTHALAADRQHDLCWRCYRALRERQKSDILKSEELANESKSSPDCSDGGRP